MGTDQGRQTRDSKAPWAALGVDGHGQVGAQPKPLPCAFWRNTAGPIGPSTVEKGKLRQAPSAWWTAWLLRNRKATHGSCRKEPGQQTRLARGGVESNGLRTGTQGPGRALARSPGRRPSFLHARCRAAHLSSQYQSDKDIEAHRGAPGDLLGPPAGSWVPCTLGPELTSNRITVSLLSGEWRAPPPGLAQPLGLRNCANGGQVGTHASRAQRRGSRDLGASSGTHAEREHKGVIISQECTANRLCVTRTRRGLWAWGHPGPLPAPTSGPSCPGVSRGSSGQPDPRQTSHRPRPRGGEVSDAGSELEDAQPSLPHTLWACRPSCCSEPLPRRPSEAGLGL